MNDFFNDDQPADLPENAGDGSDDLEFAMFGDDGLTDGAAAEAEPAEEPVEIDVPPDTGSRRDRRRRVGTATLGIYVTPTAVHGSLVQDVGDGFQVLRRFSRQRNFSDAEMPDLAGMVADTAVAEDTGDVKIQFGTEGSDSGDLFLDSEFGDLARQAEGDDLGGLARQKAAPIVFELKDILDECAAAGYERPQVAFCISDPAVDYCEILVPEDRAKRAAEEKKEKNNGKSKGEPVIKHERLLTRLSEEYDQPYDKESVGFVPMTTREGVRRFLALISTDEDPVGESIELLREQSGMRSVPLRSVDAEVPLMVGLTRWAFTPEPHENTAIVRVGTENTLVILMQGSELHHQEHMQSVTTLDGPDTICSRVLLQQDVQGIGTVHQVIVLSEEREDELVRGFSAFYPEARVIAMRRGLREHGIRPASGDLSLSARSLPALGAALNLHISSSKESPFDQANLLPKRLRRVRPKLDLFVAWHTLVVAVLLFFGVLFFIGMYFGQQRQIQLAEQRIAEYPVAAEMSPQALQAQIDSLRGVYVRITSTLNTVDSLLVGSDRWSRSMARLSRSTASTGGTWVEQWAPQGAGVQLSGFATAREQVVHFAERMDASIDELRFADIRDYPVYSFVVTAPIPNELPEVATYLRDHAAIDLPEEPDALGGALAAEEALLSP